MKFYAAIGIALCVVCLPLGVAWLVWVFVKADHDAIYGPR